MVTNIGSQELIRIARDGSAEQYAAALKETGSAVLGNALEVFSKMDREAEEGRLAIDQLKDLRNSLITHIQREKAAHMANSAGIEAELAALNKGEHPSIQLEAARTETLTDTRSILSDYDKVNTRAHLQRVWGAEEAMAVRPQVDDMRGIKKFLADLTGLQGLYTAAVLVPGPLSATVKNVAKELYTNNFSANSSATGAAHSSGATIGLLGIGGFGLERAFSSRSSAQSEARFEKSTLDERIIPPLVELQNRLVQVSVVPASRSNIEARRDLVENEGRKTWFGLGSLAFDVPLGERTYSAFHDSDNRSRRTLEQMECQPAHLRLPETSISDYAK